MYHLLCKSLPILQSCYIFKIGQEKQTNKQTTFPRLNNSYFRFLCVNCNKLKIHSTKKFLCKRQTYLMIITDDKNKKKAVNKISRK